MNSANFARMGLKFRGSILETFHSTKERLLPRDGYFRRSNRHNPLTRIPLPVFQIHGVSLNESKVSGGYDSDGDESTSSGGSVSVTGHTESPQPPAVVAVAPTTTPTNVPPTSHLSARNADLGNWYVCQPPTTASQHSPLPGPPPPHHLSHFTQILHHQATAY